MTKQGRGSLKISNEKEDRIRQEGGEKVSFKYISKKIDRSEEEEGEDSGREEEEV
jgi:hypothetical protein